MLCTGANRKKLFTPCGATGHNPLTVGIHRNILDLYVTANMTCSIEAHERILWRGHAVAPIMESNTSNELPSPLEVQSIDPSRMEHGPGQWGLCFGTTSKPLSEMIIKNEVLGVWCWVTTDLLAQAPFPVMQRNFLFPLSILLLTRLQ